MFGQKIFVLDGGLSSTIQNNGVEVDGDPLWSARLLETKPDAILDAHSDFLTAGAQILITASYQASIEGFSKYLNVDKDRARDLIKSSVSIAREAIEKSKNGKDILVAGSVGPYGACQADGSEYTGKYVDMVELSDIQQFHIPRIECLAEAGVDLLAVETLPSLKEALGILDILDHYPDMKAWVTFSCKNGKQTNYGDNFREAVKICWQHHADKLVGIGVNCSHPEHITSLLQEASEAVSPDILPRIVYPNSGETWVAQHGWAQTENASDFTEEMMKQWIDLGAKVIGGCCRVSPKEISKISKYIKNNYN